MLEAVICGLLWYFLVVYFIAFTWHWLLLFYAIKITEQYLYAWYYNAEPLSSVDAMWLLDGPKNRIIINALLILKGSIQAEKLQSIMIEKLRIHESNSNNPYKKMQMRILNGYFNYYWVHDKDFQISDHVESWPETIRSKIHLRNIVSQICSVELDKSKSPWEYVGIPYVDDLGERKTAVLMRVHHCIADGVSMARFLMRELPDTEANCVPLRKFSERNRMLLMLKGLIWGPFFLLNMMSFPADSSLLHGKELSGSKMVTWSEPIDLSVIKEIKNITSSTVNDVLVTCLVAAVRECYEKRKIRPPRAIKVSIPIDLRENMDQAAIKFENKFAIMPLELPIGMRDPLAMLIDTKRRFNELKTSGEPFAVSMAMQVFTKVLPGLLMDPINKFICEKTSAVLSNVPGPQNSLKIADSELETLTFWAPQRDNIGLSFSLSTYAGKLVVGVLSDEAILKDPDEICREYHGKVMQLREEFCEVNQNSSKFDARVFK